jgi:hypothetical protein
VKRAMSDPAADVLMSDPNSPFESPKFAFTSGNLGSQDIIKNPNRKNRSFK